MAEPPTYDRDTMSDQIKAWYAAADAYRAKNPKALADALCPITPGEPDSHTFAYLVASVCVGAYVVAINLNEANGRSGFQPPEDGEWVVEALDPRREGTAVERLCATVVATAANGEHKRAAQQVMAFASPTERGVQRLTEVQWRLMEMFVAVTAEGGVDE